MKTSLLPFVFLLLGLGLPLEYLSAEPPPLPPPAAPALAAPQGKVSPPPGWVDIANDPTVKVVGNVLPAVVNINAQKTDPQYVTVYRYFHAYRGVINRTQQSIGSGLIVSADGYIVTNAHVVALADQEKPVAITLSSGSKYQAQVISSDPDADLALLKIEDKSQQFPYFDLTYASPNLLGETVIALGSPEGYQNSVSKGILSAKGRNFTVEDHTYNNLIQTDAAINPGNSGGPLVDLNGGLVGINSAKMAGEAIESIGFAIPHETVVAWVNDALAAARGAGHGAAATDVHDVLRDRLGLAVKTLTSDKADEMNVELSGGLLITKVEDNSAASEAGLHENMIIISVGNKQVAQEKDMPQELQHLKAGNKVLLQVVSVQDLGPLKLQRGGSVLLTAR